MVFFETISNISTNLRSISKVKVAFKSQRNLNRFNLSLYLKVQHFLKIVIVVLTYLFYVGYVYTLVIYAAFYAERELFRTIIMCIRKSNNDSNYGNGGKGVFHGVPRILRRLGIKGRSKRSHGNSRFPGSISGDLRDV